MPGSLASGRGFEPSGSIAKIAGMPLTGFCSAISAWSSAAAERAVQKPATNDAAAVVATATHPPRRPPPGEMDDGRLARTLTRSHGMVSGSLPVGSVIGPTPVVR